MVLIMGITKIERENYTVEFETPTVYIDNKSRKRSGHMTHAMAEFAPDCFIDFNSNCSAVRHGGHMPYGWVEYKISKDGGKTYSETEIGEIITVEYHEGAFGIPYAQIEH